MKRIIPLLILLSMLLSACGSTAAAGNYDAEIAALNDRYTALSEKYEALEADNAELSARCEALQTQVDALAAQLESQSADSAGAYCNLFINGWSCEDGLLVLTSALFHVQIPSQVSVESAQLVLCHNGTEIARADITLESGEAQGSYQITLTDTWFVLPQLEEDDVLDLHPEVVLSNGTQLLGGTSSWFATAEGLNNVVG